MRRVWTAAIAAALLATAVPVSAMAVQDGGGTPSVTGAAVGQDARYQRRDWCGDRDWVATGGDALRGGMVGRNYWSARRDAYDDRWCSPVMREARSPRRLAATDRQWGRFGDESDRWYSGQPTAPRDQRDRSLASQGADRPWPYDCW